MAEATTVAGASSADLRRSPFEGHKPGERPNRAGQVGVRLSAGMLGGVTLVATWPGGTDGLCAALGEALGCVVPERTGATVRAAAGLLLRTGPEEFMLLSDQGGSMTARLRRTLSAEIGSVTDLSHARCRITLAGDRCRDVLSKLFALDLREQEFALNQVRLTGHHHVPCMLHRLGTDQFDMYVFSTYAFDQLSTLIDAALEYGVSLAP